MKRAVLLILGMMAFTTVNANNGKPTKTVINNRFENAVTFIEKGVQFHVFLNGDFDFNRPYRETRYRRYNNPLRIVRDYKGRIKRIENNFISYDYRGNVTRIGNVRLYYNRGLLRRVGNLKITYNRWGDPYFYGNVHTSYYDPNVHFSLNIGPVFNYNDRFFYNPYFRNNYKQYKEDRNYYYYKAKPNSKVEKDKKIIKRRKSNATNRRLNDTKRRDNSTTNKRIKNSNKKKEEVKVNRRRN